MNLRRDWNEFWFEPRPSGPLGLFRIAMGILALCWGILIAPDLYTWFSERGVFPLAAIQYYNGPVISGHELDLLRHVTNTHVLVAIFVVYMLAALFLAIGFQTRIATIVAWALLTSFHNRDAIILNAGDNFMRLMLFFLMFAPSGASCSVDRLVRIWLGRESAGDPPLINPWAQRMIQVQVSIVYASTFLGKVVGGYWQNGTAIYYPLHMHEMQRFYVPWIGTNLILVNLLTYGTLATELSLATLIWVPRLRGYVLTAGTFLHLGIEYTLNIPLFSALMISSYITFLPNEWIERFTVFVSRLAGRRALTLRYASVGALPALMAIVSRLDSLHLATIAPEDGRDSAAALVTAMDSRGRVRTGFPALRWALWRMPGAWPIAPLLYLPGMSRAGERLLQRWADSRRGTDLPLPADTPMALRT